MFVCFIRALVSLREVSNIAFETSILSGHLGRKSAVANLRKTPKVNEITIPFHDNFTVRPFC